jgi:hypothetical protein
MMGDNTYSTITKKKLKMLSTDNEEKKWLSIDDAVIARMRLSGIRPWAARCMQAGATHQSRPWQEREEISRRPLPVS